MAREAALMAREAALLASGTVNPDMLMNLGNQIAAVNNLIAAVTAQITAATRECFNFAFLISGANLQNMFVYFSHL